MKIIHTADLHLDSCLETHLNPFVAKERKKELLRNFERLIDYANAHDVNRIIIAGDLFDSERISTKTIKYLYDLINDNQNIDFIYITGNHELDAFLRMLSQKPSNLKTFSNSFDTLSYSDCDITAINYLDNYDYDSLNLNENNINILVMHGDTNTNIDINKLKNKNINYLALGHIHKYFKGEIDSRGVYSYSGCLEGRGFDECGSKGFVLINIENNEIKTEFVEFAKRTLTEVEVNISECEGYADVRKLVNLRVSDIDPQSMIKVNLTGYYNLDMVKQNEMLASNLNETFYFADLDDFTKLRINPKDFENDISLKGEFVRSVLSSDLSDDEKLGVIEYGVRALMKEEF